MIDDNHKAFIAEILCGQDKLKYNKKKKIDNDKIKNIHSLVELIDETNHELNKIFVAAKILDENNNPV